MRIESQKGGKPKGGGQGAALFLVRAGSPRVRSATAIDLSGLHLWESRSTLRVVMNIPTGLAHQAVFNAASTSIKAFQTEPKGPLKIAAERSAVEPATRISLLKGFQIYRVAFRGDAKKARILPAEL